MAAAGYDERPWLISPTRLDAPIIQYSSYSKFIEESIVCNALLQPLAICFC